MVMQYYMHIREEGESCVWKIPVLKHNKVYTPAFKHFHCSSKEGGFRNFAC